MDSLIYLIKRGGVWAVIEVKATIPYSGLSRLALLLSEPANFKDDKQNPLISLEELKNKSKSGSGERLKKQPFSCSILVHIDDDTPSDLKEFFFNFLQDFA